MGEGDNSEGGWQGHDDDVDDQVDNGKSCGPVAARGPWHSRGHRSYHPTCAPALAATHPSTAKPSRNFPFIKALRLQNINTGTTT